MIVLCKKQEKLGKEMLQEGTVVDIHGNIIQSLFKRLVFLTAVTMDWRQNQMEQQLTSHLIFDSRNKAQYCNANRVWGFIGSNKLCFTPLFQEQTIVAPHFDRWQHPSFFNQTDKLSLQPKKPTVLDNFEPRGSKGI